MTTKIIVVYITIISLFSLTQPALAQTYYFGPPGIGITWSDIWKFGRNPAVVGQPSVPFGAAAGSIMRQMAKERSTVILERGVGFAEREGVRSAIENSLRETAEKELEKAGVQAAKAASKGIKVGFARETAPALLKGLGIVTTAETILEIVWPADINWQARGWPMVCVNSPTDKYPDCYAYFVTTNNVNGLYWKALDPKRHSLLGDITQYFFNTSVEVTPLLDLAFGRPEPVCSVSRFIPGKPGVKQVSLQGSEVFNNLPPGENKFRFACFTAGESSIVKKVVQTTINTISTGLNIMVEGFWGISKLAYSLLPGGLTPDDVLIQAAPTLKALLNGTYVPFWPIPDDLLHMASVTIAVNSPPSPQTAKIVQPKQTLSEPPTLPTGYHDAVNNNTCSTSGWARDIDTPNTPVTVHIYVDKPAGSGNQPIAATIADKPRTESSWPYPDKNHGFDVLLPSLKDGANHPLYAYPIDTTTGLGNPSNPLTLSPKTIQCSKPVSAPGKPLPSVDIKVQ